MCTYKVKRITFSESGPQQTAAEEMIVRRYTTPDGKNILPIPFAQMRRSLVDGAVQYAYVIEDDAEAIVGTAQILVEQEGSRRKAVLQLFATHQSVSDGGPIFAAFVQEIVKTWHPDEALEICVDDVLLSGHEFVALDEMASQPDAECTRYSVVRFNEQAASTPNTP